MEREQDNQHYLTDDELLRGLWWGDEEFGPAVNALWREYVERRRGWMDYKCEVATALRHLHRVSFTADQEATR